MHSYARRPIRVLPPRSRPHDKAGTALPQSPGDRRPSGLVLQWQRTAGNLAVQRRLAAGLSLAVPTLQRQQAQGTGQQLLDLLKKGLEKGIGYGSDGWTVGGVPLKRFEQGAEVARRLAKGDVQGAVEVFKPRDPHERERIRQDMVALERQFRLLVPGVQEQERKALVALGSRALHLPTGTPEEGRREPFRLPDVGLHPEEFRIGGTTIWVLDRFRLESATLEPSHRRQLDDLAHQAVADPGARIDIVGHTDTSGPAAFNVGLAERRAWAVRDYLQGKGAGGAIGSVTGLGETQPRVPEHTDDDRARNRRVEIFFTGGVRRQPPAGSLHLGD